MRGLVVVAAVCVMLVACLASAGEVTKTVTIERTCVAGVCHPVVHAVVHPVSTVCGAVCGVRERVCERRACRAARRCICQVEVKTSVETPIQKAPEAKDAAVQKSTVIQRQRTRTWFRGGCVGGSCSR